MERPLVRQYVARAIIYHGNKFLLANKIGEPHWFLPGGRVEPGESVRFAVKRELSEELAIDSVPGRFVGCIEHGFSAPGVTVGGLKQNGGFSYPRLAT